MQIERFEQKRAYAVRIVRAVIEWICIFGSALLLVARQEGHALACTPLCRTGYSPASNQTSNLTQAQVNFYDANFIENLKAETPHYRCVERRPLPENSGNTLNLFEYTPFGPDLNQAPEGTVGSGETLQVLTSRITIGNYADYINYSRFAMQMAIDPALVNGTKELGYQMGQTISYILLNTTNSLTTVDSSVLVSNAYNQNFSKTNVTSAIASLRGRNVHPMEGGYFCALIHPFNWGDALNDNTNNSFTDVLKRSVEGTDMLKELPGGAGEMVEVIEWAGCKFYETTIVTTTANYQGHAGVTAYRVAIYGENGVISISMGAKENTAIGDGDWRNLKMIVKRYDDASVSDPAMMIGGSAAYNFNFAAGIVPDTTGRVRLIDAPAAIS